MSGFFDVHPIQSRGERIGRTTKMRCRFCRMINDANKQSVEQTESETAGNVIVIDSVNKVASSCVAGSGCRFCGAPNWSKSKQNKQLRRPEDMLGVPGNNKYRKR